MSSGIIRSRIVSFVSKRHRRLLSSDAVSGAPKEPLAPSFATSTASASASASSNTTTNGTAASNASPSASEANATSSNKGLRFLKYGIIGGVTAATSYAGYASYGLCSSFSLANTVSFFCSGHLRLIQKKVITLMTELIL